MSEIYLLQILPVPHLHHLVVDTVEVCGGSRQLIRVLNCLEACVANDTHDCLVTSYRCSREAEIKAHNMFNLLCLQ